MTHNARSPAPSFVAAAVCHFVTLASLVAGSMGFPSLAPGGEYASIPYLTVVLSALFFVRGMKVYTPPDNRR